jgi:hypothetical protein
MLRRDPYRLLVRLNSQIPFSCNSLTETVPTKPSFHRVLSNRPFAILWVGQLVSQSGDFIFDLVALWLCSSVDGRCFQSRTHYSNNISPSQSSLVQLQAFMLTSSIPATLSWSATFPGSNRSRYRISLLNREIRLWNILGTTVSAQLWSPNPCS